MNPQTWHYGLVAEWWAAFNTEGPEIDYFGRFVEGGQPGLDAGCGTGRLLVPWLRAGFDVDGCDVSPDMVELCRANAQREGFEPTLFVQALHELEPPRRYRTIVACGVLGLGSTRAQDQEALTRFRDNLEPGGRLVMDNEVPYGTHMRWAKWPREKHKNLPEPWPATGDRRRTDDGSEYELRTRAVAVDPLDQTVLLEMRAEKRQHGEVVAVEEHQLSMRGYFRDELLLMLEHAGFGQVEVHGEYTSEPPTADHRFLVYVARP